MVKKIVIKGAKEHNLKNISLEIPKDKFIVITGLSGSGKSSLAFDTIYAEGQRRYVESLSAYARQFLDKMKKPKVDLIEGLSPAISIEQKNTSKNPRSTVATVTEIYDYMRVLFARAGIPYSPFTGKPIKSQSVAEIVDKIKNLPKKNTIYLLAPIVRGRKGEYKKEIASYKRRGFQRVKVDGTYFNIDEFPDLNKKIKHEISIVVDRIVINNELGNRLAEGVETALNLSDGLLFVEYENETLPKKYRKVEKIIFSSKFACPESGFTIEEIEPRLFSFNSPYGACEECEGIGVNLNVDPNLVIPNNKKTLAEGAIDPWAKSSTLYYAQTLSSLAKHYKFSLDISWKKLSKEIKDIILYGSDIEEIRFSYDDGYEKYSTKKTFEGVINNLERRYLETESEWKREEISQYQSESDCEKCKGMRLKDEALCVKIDNSNISEITKKSISESKKWFSGLNEKLGEKEKEIAQHILKEINERLDFLLNVGLDYLTLSRESGTLSGGESQRIRLASQIGSGLTGVIYVLDEPSIGLHQKDNVKLINALKRLRDLGNTVIVVEHDTETMENADHIIDLGPEAGVDGVIKIIKNSDTVELAKKSLLNKKWKITKTSKLLKLISTKRTVSSYSFSEVQVSEVLELKLQKLTAYGIKEIETELKKLAGLIKEYEKLLKSKKELFNLIIDELNKIKDKFSIKRRTKIIDVVLNYNIEETIQKEAVVVTITQKGYIKRGSLSSVKIQKRGGKGKTGIKTRDEDYVVKIFTANSHTPVLFFSTQGLVYKLKAWKIPQGTSNSKGKTLFNLLPLKTHHSISSIMPLPENEKEWKNLYVVFSTSKGKIRKNSLEDFLSIQSTGKIAMKLDEDDKIVGVIICKENQDIILSTQLGKCIRFMSKKLRIFKGRSSKGIKGIQLATNDKVISLSVVDNVNIKPKTAKNLLKNGSADKVKKSEVIAKQKYILSITNNGFGKRTSFYEYRVTNRGGKGIIGIVTSERNGNVAASFPVNEGDEIILSTDKGRVIRCAVQEIRSAGRNTQGVRIFKLSGEEKVVSAIKVEDNFN